MTYNVFGGTLNPTLSIYLVSLYYSSLMLQIRMELKPPWQSFELYECFLYRNFHYVTFLAEVLLPLIFYCE